MTSCFGQTIRQFLFRPNDDGPGVSEQEVQGKYLSYSSLQVRHRRGRRCFGAEEVLADKRAELFFIILRKKVSVFKELSFNFA